MPGFIIILVMVVLFLMPHAIIWALNTLFGLQIEYGWPQWCAVLILMGTIGALTSNSSSKK